MSIRDVGTDGGGPTVGLTVDAPVGAPIDVAVGTPVDGRDAVVPNPAASVAAVHAIGSTCRVGAEDGSGSWLTRPPSLTCSVQRAPSQ